MIGGLLDGGAEILRGRCRVGCTVDGTTGDGDLCAGLLDRRDGVELHATGHGERNASLLTSCEQTVEVEARLGLLIQTGVHLDELGTQGANFLCAGGLVLDTDQVNDNTLVVGLGCLDGTGDGGVVG